MGEDSTIEKNFKYFVSSIIYSKYWISRPLSKRASGSKNVERRVYYECLKPGQF